jgi:hypothetical protein
VNCMVKIIVYKVVIQCSAVGAVELDTVYDAN